jgi:hypothetical protein
MIVARIPGSRLDLTQTLQQWPQAALRNFLKRFRLKERDIGKLMTHT